RQLRRSIRTDDAARAPGPWGFTIARNRVGDFWGSRGHRDAGLEASLDDGEPRRGTPSGEPGPLPRLENAELGRELSRAIDSLSPGMREALVLRFYERLPFDEIGARIGRNETAARKRYSRALSELREALARYVGSRP